MWRLGGHLPRPRRARVWRGQRRWGCGVPPRRRAWRSWMSPPPRLTALRPPPPTLPPRRPVPPPRRLRRGRAPPPRGCRQTWATAWMASRRRAAPPRLRPRRPKNPWLPRRPLGPDSTSEVGQNVPPSRGLRLGSRRFPRHPPGRPLVPHARPRLLRLWPFPSAWPPAGALPPTAGGPLQAMRLGRRGDSVLRSLCCDWATHLRRPFARRAAARARRALWSSLPVRTPLRHPPRQRGGVGLRRRRFFRPPSPPPLGHTGQGLRPASATRVTMSDPLGAGGGPGADTVPSRTVPAPGRGGGGGRRGDVGERGGGRALVWPWPPAPWAALWLRRPQRPRRRRQGLRRWPQRRRRRERRRGHRWRQRGWRLAARCPPASARWWAAAWCSAGPSPIARAWLISVRPT